MEDVREWFERSSRQLAARLQGVGLRPMQFLCASLNVSLRVRLAGTGDQEGQDTPGGARASVPITWRGEPVGVVETTADQGKEQAAAAAAAAAAAVVAVGLEQLWSSHYIEQLQQELEHLRSRVVQSYEDLRKLVAMEVHDTLSQRLAVLYFRIQLFEECLLDAPAATREAFLSIRQLARTLVEDASRLLLDLRPPHLEDLGLVPALRRYLESFTQQSGIQAELSVGSNWPHLTDHRAVAMYRIVQEALSNIWKHAHCRRARVSLRAAKGRATVIVEDQGVGFDVSQVSLSQNSNKGFGIFTMTERASWCGGQLRVSSKPGRGCKVQLSIPLVAHRRALARRVGV